MGPLEAASVIKLIDAIDAISGEFDRNMTIGEVEEFLYASLDDVTVCPSCRGMGRLGRDFYCKRCAGTGYTFLGE